MSDKPPTPAAEPTPAAGSSAQNPNGGKGEAETLASEEVIELQAFLERREWIEEKIRLLEKMPPIDVFGGIQEMLASSSTPITCLPSREELAEWVAEHDKIEHEAEQFDAGDMNRLKKFTKAATQRNLSREDTDLIEVTLTTLLALDRLLHLLRGRSENLELMSIRLTWEEQRLLAWNERQSVLADLQAFIANRAQWNPACYENPPSAPTIDRRLSSASNASGPPGDLSSSTSTSRSALSRGSRYMLAEVLSLDAAQFSTRLVGLSKSVAASGKTLDKLIDSSHRKPVPDELLDEQDKIENESSATEGLGKFAMAMVMQWKKSDEIYGELKKDQAAAVALREEIESAKLQHPNQKFNESFTARSAALTARLAVVGDPATSRSFPRPYHALFPNQNAANTNLTKILSRELAISAKAIREAATSAAQYQGMMENITEIERLRDTMVSLTTRLEVVTQHYTTGIPSQDGDGSIPNLEDASCLNPTRHGAFLALLPATHKEHDAVNDEAKKTKAQCTAILSKVGAAGIDPNLKSGVQAASQRLENQQQAAEAARKNVQARIETMREARNIKAAASSIQETTTQLRRQIVRALQHQRWKPQRVQDGRPLTPESPLSMGTTTQPLLTPSDAFLQADALTTQTASTVEKPLAALLESLGSSLSSALEDTQRSITHRIREVKRLTSLWESVKRQTAAMDSVRREAHNIEADLADLVYQYDTVLDLTTEESTPASLASRDAELKTLLDTTNDKAQQFINTLSTRVPFIANSAHSEAFTLASSSDDPDAPGRLPFALISLDDSVRADANAYAVSISGSLATLSKKSGYLAIARLAHEFEDHKRPVVNELDETSRLVANVQASMNKLEANGEHESSMLDALTGFEGQVEAFLKDFTPRIGSKLASVRHVFAKMTAAPGAGDSFVQERFLNSRSREVEKLAAMVDSATRDLSALANRIGSAKLLEMRRIEAEEAKLLADQRAKEEAEERARLEAEIARFEEEERKRKELEELRRVEMEQARIEAEEAAKRAEEERKRAQEAEQARLKAEREAEMLEQQRLREEELARVDAEKRRLEAEAEAHREAEAAARRELEEGRRREQEMASKIAAEREAQEVEKRRRRDTETERLAEEARLRAEVARQEAEILRLAEEIRRDRDARSSADVPQVDEFGVVSTGSPSASALVVVSPEGAMEGSEVFGSHSGDGRHMSEDMIQLKNKIDSIRKELRDIGINALARPSLNAPFPAKAEVDKMRVRFLRLQKERSKLPGSSPDALLNAELTSLKFEVDNSVILMAHLTRLVEFVKRLGVCDGALSELLNHVDSFPALPAGEDLVYHYSDPKETPKAQLGARLTFTEAAVDKVKTCAEGLAADNRVTEESKRIQQTWDELRDMANDCLIEMPSRPSTSTSISSMSTTSVRRRTMVPSASAPSPLDLSTRRGPSTPRANMGTQSRTPSQSSSLRRSSSRISTRSVSGPTFSTPKAPAPKPAANTGGFKIRERTTSTSSSSNPTGIFATSSRLLASTFSSRQHANRSNVSISTPQLRPESRFSSHSRGPSPLPSYQTPSRGGTWSKARRPSLGATLPRNFKTAAETTPKPRRTYVPNPTNKLDVAVGAVVNQLPVEINIEASEDNWKDQSGKYWIGDEDPKLCYCRILRSSTVMVRVGGGWVELSKFIKDHFADLFRLLPITATPPHAPQNEPRWISSATLQEENENTPTRPKYRGASKPGTPEPRRAPSRASVSPSFFTPPGISPNGPTSSANSSPLTPIQFMRRVDESGPRARPTSPLSRTVRGRGQPLGRPAAWR